MSDLQVCLRDGSTGRLRLYVSADILAGCTSDNDWIDISMELEQGLFRASTDVSMSVGELKYFSSFLNTATCDPPKSDSFSTMEEGLKVTLSSSVRGVIRLCCQLHDSLLRATLAVDMEVTFPDCVRFAAELSAALVHGLGHSRG